MPTYTYPTNRELREIAPVKSNRLQANRLGFQLLPIRSVRAAVIQWTQRDNFGGLQQLRGLDGAPTHVKMVGAKKYSYEPGVYGEFMSVNETELTLRSGSVEGDVSVNVGDLVLERQDILIQRELDRIESIIWTLLTTGVFSINLAGPEGGVGFTDEFDIQTDTGSDWSNAATGTPIADFIAAKGLGRAAGTNFGAGATAYVNGTTAAYLSSNRNEADLWGANGETFRGPDSTEEANTILARKGLPRVVEYDEGYHDDEADTFTPFIPDDKVVIIGQRPAGQTIGEYVMTLNANNPGQAPGSYDYVVDRINGTNGEKRTPPNLEVHRGHNGGPLLYYPGSILVLSV